MINTKKIFNLLAAALLLVLPHQASAAIDPATAQKLLAADGLNDDWFGYSVSVSGDTAVIGAHVSGSTYIFTRTNGVWSQQAKLLADDGGNGFGYSVSVSGDMAVVGAPSYYSGKGAAYIFTRTSGVWSQQAKLLADDGAMGDYFGHSVSISGETAIVSAYRDDSTKGAAYVFTRTSGVWSQQAKLLADDGAVGDYFGASVSVSGDTAIVGAYGDDSGKGAAYVFTRTGSTWSQQQKLLSDNGSIIDSFGNSVSISGDTAVVGASGDDMQGTAYVFTRTGSTWSQQQKLIAAEGVPNDRFGISVSVSGDTAVIGMWEYVDEKGSAYIFTRTDGTWNQQTKLTAADGVARDHFGNSVAVSGDTAVIGTQSVNKGSAYVFTRTGSTWNQQTKLTAANSAGGGESLQAIYQLLLMKQR